MLGDKPVAPTIPVTDLARAKVFYQDKLGLILEKEMPEGISFKAGGNTHLYLYNAAHPQQIIPSPHF